MMKTTLYIAAGVAAVLLYMRGKKQDAAKTAIQEAVPTDGTNWVGKSVWDRMDGSDLRAQTGGNLAGSLNADPGKMGQAELGLQPSWNGGL